MRRIAWLCLLVSLLSACTNARAPAPDAKGSSGSAAASASASASAGASAPAPVVEAPIASADAVSTTEGSAVVAPPRQCAVPRALKELANADASARYESDPPADTQALPDEESRPITIGARTFTMIDDDTGHRIVAKEGARVVWSGAPMLVAGGSFGLSATPGGGFLVRTYSRGENAVFRASDGASAGALGRDAELASDDSFALDPPALDYGTGKYATRDVKKIALRTQQKKVVARIEELPVGKEVESPEIADSFGVAVCGASYYVVSQASALDVYRATDDVKATSFPRPGPGRPRMSRSGDAIYLIFEGNLTRAFQVVR